MFGLEEAIGEGPSKGLQNGRGRKSLKSTLTISSMRIIRTSVFAQHILPNTSSKWAIEHSSFSGFLQTLCLANKCICNPTLTYSLGFFHLDQPSSVLLRTVPSSLPHPELLLARQAGSTHCTTGQCIREMRCWSTENKSHSESNWPRGWQPSTSK